MDTPVSGFTATAHHTHTHDHPSSSPAVGHHAPLVSYCVAVQHCSQPGLFPASIESNNKYQFTFETEGYASNVTVGAFQYHDCAPCVHLPATGRPCYSASPCLHAPPLHPEAESVGAVLPATSPCVEKPPSGACDEPAAGRPGPTAHTVCCAGHAVSARPCLCAPLDSLLPNVNTPQAMPLRLCIHILGARALDETMATKDTTDGHSCTRTVRHDGM